MISWIIALKGRMSIRIREVNGVLIAVCAARSVPKDGDFYLDDRQHYALAIKFNLDHQADGFAQGSVEQQLMETEESNNSNRQSWDDRMKELEKH